MAESAASMNVLVACTDCGRHFDASELPLGALFRCYCGKLVKVPAVTAKDATVVRCSACGAPRSQEATACEHCHADFTAHERDMHTTCPDCLARISDKARFCHHCGTRIGSRTPAGSPTEHPCPACAGRAHLSHRQLGKAIPVLECPACAGVWLTHDAAEQVLKQSRAIAEGHTAEPGQHTTFERPDLPRQTGPLYRNCPICDQMMSRSNHGRRSGVIVDRCNAHGVWFDEQELAAIVAWVRSGGERRAERAQAEDARNDARRDLFKEHTRGRTASGTLGADDDRSGGTPLWVEILGQFL